MSATSKKSIEKVAFIVNPESGTRAKSKSKNALGTYIKQYTGIELIEPKTAKATFDMAKEFAESKFNAVFACGGDGTLNLVSSALVGTNTALGIIPFGSGNGYARHHKIPMKWQQAVKILDAHEETVRDTGLINGIHFLNVAGIGYAAKISAAFKTTHNRGLAGYLLTIAKNMKREPFHMAITEGYGVWEGNTWMVEFCNGSQWGNNISIAPGAQDDDGTINAVIFEPFNSLKLPSIGFKIANSNTEKVPEIKQIQGDKFLMKFEGTQSLHVDGESIGHVEQQVAVQVVPKSLKIWRFPS